MDGAASTTPKRPGTRTVLLVLMGSFLIQAAWILAVPPFRGIDEFDHVFRAASIADGAWLPSGDTVGTARGELLWVPSDLVETATPVCNTYEYTGRHNCTPLVAIDEQSRVASAAARYNPVYYWIVGKVAAPFHAESALYAMRLATALICAAMIAIAAWATTLWARTRWPLFSVLVALTPVTMYSTIVVAPNGLEATAALGVWAVGLALGSPHVQHPRLLLGLLTLLSVPLIGVRGLGPLWFLVVMVILVLAMGLTRARGLARSQPLMTMLLVVVTAVVGLAASAWTLLAGSMELEEEYAGQGSPITNSLSQIPLWVLQSIAAFPTRNEPAPPVVYAAGVVVVGGLLAVAVSRSSRHLLLLTVGTALLAVLIPLVLQIAAYPTAGIIWQGRYGWPLSMGVVLLAGVALEHRPPTSRWTGPVLLAGTLGWVIAHTVSVWDVARGESLNSPLAGTDVWLTLPPAVLGAVAATGIGLWGAAVLLWSSAAAPREKPQLAALTGSPVIARSSCGQ